MMTRNTAQQLADAARALRVASQERDRLIRRRREQGATLRAIGDEAGLTHTAVAKILARAR